MPHPNPLMMEINMFICYNKQIMRVKKYMFKKEYFRSVTYAILAGLFLVFAGLFFASTVQADDTPVPVLKNSRTNQLVSEDEAAKIKFLKNVSVTCEYGEAPVTGYYVSVLKAEDNGKTTVSYDISEKYASDYTAEYDFSVPGKVSVALPQNEKNTVYFVGLIPLDENSHPSSLRASTYYKIFIVGTDNQYVNWCDFKYENNVDEDNSIMLPGFRTYVTGYYDTEGAEHVLNDFFFNHLTEYTYSGKAYIRTNYPTGETNPLSNVQKIILQSKG